MSQPPTVPYTSILRRYHEVIATETKDRFELAQHLTAHPEELAGEFESSIAELAAGYSHQGPFRPERKTPEQPKTPGISKGPDIAWYLHRQHHLPVDGRPELNVEWVDYELSILSTPGAVEFDKTVYAKPNPKSENATGKTQRAGRAIKADVVLRNAADQTPVIGEVKYQEDKEPFSGLVQLLAYIAHLATPSQYERLRTHTPPLGFPAADPPRFDGYLLLYEFGLGNSEWLKKFGRQAEKLADVLMQQPAIARHVRQLVCLDLRLENDTLRSGVRWLSE